jgi:hypothetical protein
MVLNLRSWITVVALPLALSVVAPSCARQAEGARCNRANGNLDCQDGGASLVCTVSSELRGGADKVDRCCPPRGETISDSRCERRVGGGGNEGGGPGEGGTTSSDGSGGGDTSPGGSTSGAGLGEGCAYNSECVDDLVCGPGGICQYECRVSDDCDDGKTCKSRKCVAEGDSTP